MEAGGVRVADRILARLAKLEEYVQTLERLRGADFRDPISRGALERYLQVAAEAALDVGEMVIVRSGLPKPESYKGVIRALVEAGVIDAELGAAFDGIAGLRNVLVHDYARVEPARLVAFLGKLDDFRAFAKAIVRALELK